MKTQSKLLSVKKYEAVLKYLLENDLDCVYVGPIGMTLVTKDDCIKCLNNGAN